jgi:hypothetical protein
MLKPIELELARKVFLNGQPIVAVPSPFSTPNGDGCQTNLIVFEQRFYVLTTTIPNKYCHLMKAGHFEGSSEIVKEMFGEYVDFVEFFVEPN